jgi:hypothetical protein
MKIIDSYTKEEKLSVIMLSEEVFSVAFYENDTWVGGIEYPNKHISYVKDAASNWIDGILTRDTIKQYSSAL